MDDTPERLFEMVFNQQFQFMAILSPDGRVLKINQLALTQQGAKREDYVGSYSGSPPHGATCQSGKKFGSNAYDKRHLNGHRSKQKILIM
jgi:hypothetical protein